MIHYLRPPSAMVMQKILVTLTLTLNLDPALLLASVRYVSTSTCSYVDTYGKLVWVWMRVCCSGEGGRVCLSSGSSFAASAIRYRLSGVRPQREISYLHTGSISMYLANIDHDGLLVLASYPLPHPIIIATSTSQIASKYEGERRLVRQYQQ